MACLSNFFVFFISIAEVKADLIGYNRFGNNVRYFYRFGNGQNYGYQLTNYQLLMENTTLTIRQKKELLNFFAQETSVQNFLNQRKTTRSTRKRNTRSYRLNAYKRRMNHEL